MRRSFVLVLIIAVAGAVATAGSATPRSGALHVTKECSQYNGTVGSFCTITSSSINTIDAGMRVVYLAAPANGRLNADVVLSFEHGSAAYGHVALDLATRTGTVTFSGGTGRFAGFEAAAAVSVSAGGVWHWDGTYNFTPHK